MITMDVVRREFHEVAAIFPMMGDEDYQALVQDIGLNGLREPVWTYENKIIDGRNRYKACCELGLEPTFREWDGNGSLVAFVVSLNLKRRHLTSSQKAMVALEVERQLAEEAKEKEHQRKSTFQIFEKSPPAEPIHAAQKAAEITGTNRQYVADAKKIVQQAPELKEAVLSGTLNISDAKVVATLPEPQRAEVVSKIASGEVKDAKQAKAILREEEREQRREENRQVIAKAKTIDEALGTAKFATTVIDPPWDWGDEGDVDQFGRAKPTYQTMSIEQLLELPVGNYADEDSHLYLWITNRSLPKGFQLLEAWGFRYVTCVTWGKPYFGMGNYFRGQTEHLLFGIKGSQMLKRKDAGTLFSAPRGPNGHSSKPLESYLLIESCSPGPYLELFARSQRPDWTSWGAEAEQDQP